MCRDVHRIPNVTESLESSAHLSIRFHSYFFPIESMQPTFIPATYLCINPFLVVLRECALLIPLSHWLSSEAESEDKLLKWCRGEEGCLAELPRGRQWRITRPDPKLRKVTGGINCRGSVGSQCPLCIWGIFCWWPAIGPHTPGGRGACRVIS